MKIIKSLTLAALAASLLLQTSIARADDQSPPTISFQKCVIADGSFVGTVSGDCGDGTVVAVFLSVTPGKAIWHFTGEYTVTTPGCSFTTVCTGVLDVRSGHIVVNGVVTEGDNLGAQVHVRAEANADVTCSQGTMTITPN